MSHCCQRETWQESWVQASILQLHSTDQEPGPWTNQCTSQIGRLWTSYLPFLYISLLILKCSNYNSLIWFLWWLGYANEVLRLVPGTWPTANKCYFYYFMCINSLVPISCPRSKQATYLCVPQLSWSWVVMWSRIHGEEWLDSPKTLRDNSSYTTTQWCENATPQTRWHRET